MNLPQITETRMSPISLLHSLDFPFFPSGVPNLSMWLDSPVRRCLMQAQAQALLDAQREANRLEAFEPYEKRNGLELTTLAKEIFINEKLCISKVGPKNSKVVDFSNITL